MVVREDWLTEARRCYPSWKTSFFENEANAVESKHVGSQFVPGLLQTERYALAALSASFVGRRTPAFVESAVRFRMMRQWNVFERSHPLHFGAVLDESAVHRALGGSEVLREQLRHLLNLTDEANIEIRILPFAAGFAHGVRELQICYGQDGSARAHVDDISDIHDFIDPLAVENMEIYWASAREQALSPDASKVMINDKIRELTSIDIDIRDYSRDEQGPPTS
jgi:hypothetical protein